MNENDDATNVRMDNGYYDCSIGNDGGVPPNERALKLSFEDECPTFAVDVRKEHKECDSKNYDGLSDESARLATDETFSYIDMSPSKINKIHSDMEKLRKMLSGKSLFRDRRILDLINVAMREVCDTIIADTNNFKKYLNN